MTDWDRHFRDAASFAADYHRSGTAIGPEALMWALLCDAARVTALAYRAQPYQGYPTKSAWPDAPDEITWWQQHSAYLRGEVEDLPADDSRPPIPTAAEISRAEAVLHLWHHAVTLGRQRKRAVYLRACQRSAGKVTRITGETQREQKAARRRAIREMLGAIK